MKQITLFGILCVCMLLCFSALYSCSNAEDDAFSERVKIAIREVGNQLLLADKDSTSLVLPVIALNDSKFELSFEKVLSLEPDNIVLYVDDAFKKSNLPKSYRVEIIQCSNGEVAYSYQKTIEKETTIIPCAGRSMPNDCYTIQIKFISRGVAPLFSKKTWFYLYVVSVLFLLSFYFYKKKNTENHHEAIEIGSFHFYPEENKLVKAATEITLSKKECELLEIFVANPNKIVKRDELSKKVWEDHGVVVGRSLDTYISKLRKKLQEDETIKLTNIHGVGYKLEV